MNSLWISPYHHQFIQWQRGPRVGYKSRILNMFYMLPLTTKFLNQLVLVKQWNIRNGGVWWPRSLMPCSIVAHGSWYHILVTWIYCPINGYSRLNDAQTGRSSDIKRDLSQMASIKNQGLITLRLLVQLWSIAPLDLFLALQFQRSGMFNNLTFKMCFCMVISMRMCIWDNHQVSLTKIITIMFVRCIVVCIG